MTRELSRRKFIRYTGVLMPSFGKAFAETRQPAVLVDTTKCVACRLCSYACKEENKLPAKDPAEPMEQMELNPYTWTVIRLTHGSSSTSIKTQCMHCLSPSCVNACPTTALRKNEFGAVVYEQELCVGCKVCIAACPFRIPEWNTYVNIPKWNKEGSGVSKCYFCSHRLEKGKVPACVEVCPSGALEFNDRDVILLKAQVRAAEIGGYIYGDDEAGGTSWIYILPDHPEVLGLSNPPPMPPPTRLSLLLASSGLIMFAGLAFMVGVVLKRKDRMAKKDANRVAKNEVE